LPLLEEKVRVGCGIKQRYQYARGNARSRRRRYGYGTILQMSAMTGLSLSVCDISSLRVFFPLSDDSEHRIGSVSVFESDCASSIPIPAQLFEADGIV
jgi:hypothetical protein